MTSAITCTSPALAFSSTTGAYKEFLGFRKISVCRQD